jgi:hypothetical protein
MCNRSKIWALRPRNTVFQLVFATNWRFSVKLKAPLDFEPKFKSFKTHKNLYTERLCVTDLKYGFYDQKIWNFGQFLPQTSVFRLTPLDFEVKFELFLNQ